MSEDDARALFASQKALDALHPTPATQRVQKGWTSATVRTSRGREDLRGQLAAMRKLAYRLGWLDRSIDPLDGLELLASDNLHGTTGMYISPYLRPESRQVEAMARAAAFLCKPGSAEPLLARTPLLGTQIRVAGYGGLRLGEQLALRAVDVFFDEGWVYVNGSWVTPRKQDGRGYRKSVKNRVLHEVPLPRSLMADELLPRVRHLLGVATLQKVTNAQQAERDRRAHIARSLEDPRSVGTTCPSSRPTSCGYSLTLRLVSPLDRRHSTIAGIGSTGGSTRTSRQCVAAIHPVPQSPPPPRHTMVPPGVRRGVGNRRDVPRRQITTILEHYNLGGAADCRARSADARRRASGPAMPDPTVLSGASTTSRTGLCLLP